MEIILHMVVLFSQVDIFLNMIVQISGNWKVPAPLFEFQQLNN